MKSVYIFIISFIIMMSGFSQEEFSFELYIEDAIGNRDTVIIGYDINATDSIDVSFNEINLIDSAWSNPLEARVGVNSFSCGNNNDPICLSQKSISPRYPGTTEFWLNVSIYVRCDNYPIKFSWDDAVFIADNSIVGTMIAGDCWSHYCSDVITSDFVQLSDIDSIQFSDPSSSNPTLEFAFAENGQDIRKASFAFNDWSTYCGWGAIDEMTSKVFVVSPNPSQGCFDLSLMENISSNTAIVFEVSNLLGEVVSLIPYKNSKTSIDLVSENSGIYLLRVIENGIVIETHKLIKE